jgi:hypothetical protein
VCARVRVHVREGAVSRCARAPVRRISERTHSVCSSVRLANVSGSTPRRMLWLTELQSTRRRAHIANCVRASAH